MHGLFPFGQAGSLFLRDDLPSGVLPPGTAPIIAIGAMPQHPSNAVLVQIRRDGGAATLLRAIPQGSLSQPAAQQWYRVILPTLGEGHRVDYRIELIRSGQRLATFPADGSWLTVIGDRDTAGASRKPGPVRSAEEASSTVIPRWPYELTFFATLSAQLRLEVIGETPEGHRINLFVQSGDVVGPHIDAIIRPEGGDWMCIRRDGIGMVDIRVTYETADGSLIYERARGICDFGSNGYAQIMAGDLSGKHPFYVTPTFATAHANWRWLNRRQGFGIGKVEMADLRVVCDIYFARVLERHRDG